jgi:microcystin-dependent protein
MALAQLGQVRSATADAPAQLYSLPNQRSVALLRLTICNVSGADTTYRVFKDDEAATFDQSTAIVYDVALEADKVVRLGLGTLDASGSSIGVSAGDNDAVTFTLHGSESFAEDDDMALTGEVRAFAGSTISSGWLACDGTSFTTAAKAALFAAIGYTWGGSGANFNVPDLRGRQLIGDGTGAGLTARTLGDAGGQEAITDVPQHNHALGNDGIQDTPNQTAPDDGYCLAEFSGYHDGTADVRLQPSTTDNAGSASVNVMNPFAAVKWIIKE